MKAGDLRRRGGHRRPARRLAISQMIADRAGQPLSLPGARRSVRLARRGTAHRGGGPPPQPRRPVPAGHPHHPRRSAARGFDRVVRVTYDVKEGIAQRDRRPAGGDDGLADLSRRPPGPFPRRVPGTWTPLNRLFSDAFTDRYRPRRALRDAGAVPQPPRLALARSRTPGRRAMMWRDDRGHLAAFNMMHLSGTEGWMGPLAGAPRPAGSAAKGSASCEEGIDWLKRPRRQDHRARDPCHGRWRTSASTARWDSVPGT